MDLQDTMLLRKIDAAIAAKRYFDARAICTRILKDHKNHPAALYKLAQTAWKEAEHKEAIDLLKRLVAAQPRNAAARIQLGLYLNEYGRYRDAMVQFERVLKHDANNAVAVAGLANSLELRGDVDRALSRLAPFLGGGKETPEMVRIAARIALQRRDFDEALRLTERHTHNADVNSFDRSQLLYIAAQALEAQGDYDAAFDRYRRANEARPIEFDPHQEENEIDAIIAAYSAMALGGLPRATTDSSQLVFIISRPRSGGTLVERILGAHPDVHNAGEIPALVKIATSMSFRIGSQVEYPRCIRDLDQDDVNRLSSTYLDTIATFARRAKRVTDKHLYTWRHVGLIEALFPQASIIDLRRDAMDNCLACYMAPLGERYPFSYDLAHLGFAHRQYERLMDHWHTVMPNRMLHVKYENLVADPETWSRRLVEHCGLPWDDACLSFHARQKVNSTAAPTLSNAQVRQPIYRTSVGRAARFAAHVQPLEAALLK